MVSLRLYDRTTSPTSGEQQGLLTGQSGCGPFCGTGTLRAKMTPTRTLPERSDCVAAISRRPFFNDHGRCPIQSQHLALTCGFGGACRRRGRHNPINDWSSTTPLGFRSSPERSSGKSVPAAIFGNQSAEDAVMGGIVIEMERLRIELGSEALDPITLDADVTGTVGLADGKILEVSRGHFDAPTNNNAASCPRHDQLNLPNQATPATATATISPKAASATACATNTWKRLPLHRSASHPPPAPIDRARSNLPDPASDAGGTTSQGRIFDLAAIEASLRAVEARFRRINPHLDSPRDPLDRAAVDHMLKGYAFIDRLIDQKIDLFSLGRLQLFLELNALVLFGQDEQERSESAGHLVATDERFYDDESGGIRDVVEWHALHAHESAWGCAAGVYIRVLSEPELFIEGNHRTGALLMGYILGRAGHPPFVLTLTNAKPFLDWSTLFTTRRKASLLMRCQMPWLKRRFAAFLAAEGDPKFLRMR